MNGVKRTRTRLEDTAKLTIPTIETVDEMPVFTPAGERRTHWLVLLVACISGAGLMAPMFRDIPLAMDEYGTYWIMSDENPLTLMQRSLKYENIPPLSPFVRSYFFDAFGRNETAFRIPIVVWYFLTIAGVYLLGRELLGPYPAALAALICAWHQNVLGEVRIARCYGLGLMLATFAFWVTVKWSKSPNRIRWAIAWVALNSALVWTHYLNVAVTLAQIVILAYALRRENIHVKCLGIVSLAAYVLSLLPLLKPIFRMAAWGSSFGFQEADPLFKVLIPLWWLGVPVGLAIGFVVSQWKPGTTSFRIPWASFVMLLLWGLLPPLLATIVCRDELASLSNPRYRIGFAGPASCLIAAVLAHRQTRLTASIAVVGALIAAWSVAPRLPWELKRLGHAQSYEWKKMALHIEEHGQSGEPIFVQSGLGESHLIPAYYLDNVFLDYAACRLGRFYCKTPHPRIGLPFLWGRFIDMDQHYIDLVRTHARTPSPTLWVAGATDTDLNDSSVSSFRDLLRLEGYRQIEEVEHPNSVLAHYRYEPAK